ncbi:alpha/beta fold hydrolase [Pseudorhodoferax sp. Leaf267]|uniref:alpha/beta fold hydrolase n=1 Tax=Pseudorhodoferax sp. Leaf267 TaxID=1736316 RepID=UPI0012E0F5D3|nr:alpha/beta fold hydrolase [Pseudorhodoferax sp. Leaf267]
MQHSTITIDTRDGISVQTSGWAPADVPRAVVQLQHGLDEHAGRYRRFGQALTAAGYLVYAPDARGSGRNAAGAYGRWGANGWLVWIDDVHRLNRRIRADQPGLPLALIGHSLGSFAAQQYLLDHSADVQAAVLLGTSEPAGIAAMLSAEGPVDLSRLNQGFEHSTCLEWLSRDAAEVDLYCADPACGFLPEPFSGIATLGRAADPAALSQVRVDLPILLLSGEADPIAGPGGSGVQLVGQRLPRGGRARCGGWAVRRRTARVA